MKEKRFTILGIFVAVSATLAVTLGGLFLAAWLIIGPQGMTLLEGMSLINTLFVGDYQPQTVADGAMTGMVDALGDRWSHYLTAQQNTDQQARRENAYVGIGVTVDYGDTRGLLIQEVTAGGPAEQAGLLPGEIITAAAGESLAGEARHTGIDQIKGEAGTAVALTILGTDGTERSITVTRGKLEVVPVTYSLMEDGTGYVRLTNFYLRSADMLIAAVDDLVAQGAKALVFDLRNNGGGYVDQLASMLDHLLAEGPIFRSQDRAGRETVIQSDALHVDLPMAVLVNGNTYSAAEFFAAELRERGVGVVVGEKTSGKGYSQQSYPVPGGGAMSISTGKYFTGEGKSLIGTGLTLDREVVLSAEDAALLAANQLPQSQDPQLQAALELLEEKENR